MTEQNRGLSAVDMSEAFLLLAHEGAEKIFGVDLMTEINERGSLPPMDVMVEFARLGARTPEEREFVEAVVSNTG